MATEIFKLLKAEIKFALTLLRAGRTVPTRENAAVLLFNVFTSKFLSFF